MSREQNVGGGAPRPHWEVVEQAMHQHQQTHRSARRALRLMRRTKRAKPDVPAQDRPPVVFLTPTLARHTLALLTSTNPGLAPAVVYWFGFECGERACVTTLIIPEEESRTDAILASAVANEELFSAIVGASLSFLGQVRIHPGEGLPQVDAGQRDVRFEGAFSIDIPEALEPNGTLELDRCIVHRQVDGKCKKISAEDMEDHLRVIPGFKDLRKSRSPAPRVVSPPPGQGTRSTRMV